MNKHVIAIAFAALAAAPAAHADVELMGKSVQVYGKLHVSYDLYDRGSATGAVPDPKDGEIASNSSRLGFKGEIPLGDSLVGLWKFESEIDVTGEVGELKARNRYVGLGGGWGQVLLGIHDTPLKSLAGSYTVFGDTVGDRRGILGQTSDGKNLFNVRAKNMVMYGYKSGGIDFKLLHASDFEDVSDPDQSQNALLSASVMYSAKPWRVGLAYETQSDMGGTAGADASAIRIGGNYDFGGFTLGALYEVLNNDGFGARTARNAYAINGTMKLDGHWKIAAQYMQAAESDALGDGASEVAIGAYYKINKHVELYAMYASLSNDAGASYRLARSGHGQSFNPSAAGESVKAASVGLSIGF